MTQPPLKVAFWDYDRTAPLLDGRVRIEGRETDITILRPQETFVRAFGGAEFDICELSLSRHAQAVARGDDAYVGLPVFLSRAFRHGSIYVRGNGRRPADLRGSRIGLANFDDTAAVVVRAILREHSVETNEVRWVLGDVEAPARQAIAVPPLPGISLEAAPTGRFLDIMLAEGELDALISLNPPPSFRDGDGRVSRLFPDWPSAERDWFRSCGLFPVMHLVGIRRDVIERDPGIVEATYRAFAGARSIAMKNLTTMQAPKAMLPWIVAELEATQALMGEDFWAYGVEPNRGVLDWTLDQMRRDGLMARPIRTADLFHPIIPESLHDATQLS
ncbi:MAG: ABC transporter substrate-binding protein [Rhizobiaceae bacterium]|nr:ABC transporter substrate-binding protein [Rhizobiaceae bacterium]